MRQRRGFTLVELCVVIAVLAILAAFAVPAFAGMRGAGEDRIAEENLRVIQSAYEAVRSRALSDGRLGGSYEAEVHYARGNGYEAYLNGAVDALLPEELLGLYDVRDKVSAGGARDCLIRYRANGKIYQLQNGNFLPPEEEAPPDPPDPPDPNNETGGRIADNMRDLVADLQDMTPAQRKQYFIDNGYEVPNNNISNDTYRKFLYYTVYGGAWPELSEEFKQKHGLTQPHLYIQPFAGDLTDPESVVTFARTDGSAEGGWYTGLIYDKDEGVWYKGPSFSINSVNGGRWPDVKAKMRELGWTALQ